MSCGYKSQHVSSDLTKRMYRLYNLLGGQGKPAHSDIRQVAMLRKSPLPQSEDYGGNCSINNQTSHKIMIKRITLRKGTKRDKTQGDEKSVAGHKRI